MSLEVAIVGLPNSGKSTLFNALLGRQIADVAEYPFTTIEPNVGVVEVPDERLSKLAEIVGKVETGHAPSLQIKEIILATNLTMEGETTAMFTKNRISELGNKGIRVTRIARGLPTGGDIEYADQMTLIKSVEGRVEY